VALTRNRRSRHSDRFSCSWPEESCRVALFAVASSAPWQTSLWRADAPSPNKECLVSGGARRQARRHAGHDLQLGNSAVHPDPRTKGAYPGGPRFWGCRISTEEWGSRPHRHLRGTWRTFRVWFLKRNAVINKQNVER